MGFIVKGIDTKPLGVFQASEKQTSLRLADNNDDLKNIVYDYLVYCRQLVVFLHETLKCA